MDNHEFEDLGKKIQDIVDNAVNSNSYHELSHTINQTVNKAIDSGSEALKNAMNPYLNREVIPSFERGAILIRAPITEKAKKRNSRPQRNRQSFFMEKPPVKT